MTNRAGLELAPFTHLNSLSVTFVLGVGDERGAK